MGHMRLKWGPREVYQAWLAMALPFFQFCLVMCSLHKRVLDCLVSASELMYQCPMCVKAREGVLCWSTLHLDQKQIIIFTFKELHASRFVAF